MLDPVTLLEHADRLLATAPTEADVRRAISSTYYAVFNLLTAAAANLLISSPNAELRSRIRRGMEHRGLRKICEAVQNCGSSAPRSFEGLVSLPLSPKLIAVAGTFSRLQDRRNLADYDLEVPPTLSDAQLCTSIARQAFSAWADIANDPQTEIFLTALLLADRWARRG